MNKYKYIYVDGHSVLEHRYLMEQHLGRKLGRFEFVHHINGNKSDNRLENLVVMDSIDHSRLHNEKLSKVKICVECGKEFIPPVSHRGRNKICSAKCWSIHQKKVSPYQGKFISAYLNGVKVKTYKSVKEAADELHDNLSCIARCARGEIKHSYGYVWEYEEPNI